jgi:hypothetical protein
MKLPAVWMAATFAAGIGLASHSHAPPKLWITAASIAILVGATFAWRTRIIQEWIVAMFAWFALGGAALCIERAQFQQTTSRN